MGRKERVSYDLAESYISDALSGARTDSGRIRSRIVRELLCDCLTQRQREYLLLRYRGNMNGSEIARMYGVNRSAVSATLSRARKKLAVLLGTQKLREDMEDYFSER